MKGVVVITIVFTVREEERKKLSYILDSEEPDEIKDQKLINLLHELVSYLPYPDDPMIDDYDFKRCMR